MMTFLETTITPELFIGIVKILLVFILISAAFIIAEIDIMTLLSRYVFQSVLLTILAFVLFLNAKNTVLLYLCLLTFVTKVFILPWYIRRIHLKMNMKVDTGFRYLTPTTSVFVSIFLTMLTYVCLSPVLEELSLSPLFSMGAVAGISLAIMGLIIMFSRSKALTKILGYLTMENGVLLIGLFVSELPLIIEFLVIIDLIMFIMLSIILAFGIDASIEEFHKRLNPFPNWFTKEYFKKALKEHIFKDKDEKRSGDD